MKIVGCDLHAKQQTIAMVDTETGEFSEKTLAHEGSKVREFYAALKVRWWWVSKPPEPCSGFCNCWKSWRSSAGWGIRLRFGPKKHGSRSTIGELRGWSSSCSWKIASRPSSCPSPAARQPRSHNRARQTGCSRHRGHAGLRRIAMCIWR